jgi:hypothetical protein
MCYSQITKGVAWGATHRPDDGGSKHLWNVCQFLRDDTAQHFRRRSSSYSPPWKLEISPKPLSFLPLLEFDLQFSWTRRPTRLAENLFYFRMKVCETSHTRTQVEVMQNVSLSTSIWLITSLPHSVLRNCARERMGVVFSVLLAQIEVNVKWMKQDSVSPAIERSGGPICLGLGGGRHNRPLLSRPGRLRASHFEQRSAGLSCHPLVIYHPAFIKFSVSPFSFSYIFVFLFPVSVFCSRMKSGRSPDLSGPLCWVTQNVMYWLLWFAVTEFHTTL